MAYWEEHAVSTPELRGNHLGTSEYDRGWYGISIALSETTNFFPASAQAALKNFHDRENVLVHDTHGSGSSADSEDLIRGTAMQRERCGVRNRSIHRDDSTIQSKGKAMGKVKILELEKRYWFL